MVFAGAVVRTTLRAPMTSKASTVSEYLAGLPEDRRAAVDGVRAVIRRRLGKGFEEGIQYGMIGYYVPHSVYPPGYHCDPRQPLPFIGLASQKQHLSLYLLGCVHGVPGGEAWFRSEWAKTGKKLDMGKACVRFRKVEDLALDVIGEAIRRVPVETFIQHYESTVRGPGRPPRAGQARAKAQGGAASGAAKRAGPAAKARRVRSK